VTVRDLLANFAALTGADIADMEANGVTAGEARRKRVAAPKAQEAQLVT
jgi:hypothetical protein